MGLPFVWTRRIKLCHSVQLPWHYQQRGRYVSFLQRRTSQAFALCSFSVTSTLPLLSAAAAFALRSRCSSVIGRSTDDSLTMTSPRAIGEFSAVGGMFAVNAEVGVGCVVRFDFDDRRDRGAPCYCSPFPLKTHG